MKRLQAFTTSTCGVEWKELKDRTADQRQHYIGFWWTSSSTTRCNMHMYTMYMYM